MPPDRLALQCAGAARGVVEALSPRFERETGAAIDATFGAVGALAEAIAAGAPCDAIVLTATMIAEAAVSGRVVAGSGRSLGRVWTGVAVRAQDVPPPIGDREALRAALVAAEAIYVPDLARSSAGIHFARVLAALGVSGELAPRLREYPSGGIAMRELARARDRLAIGCTQETEIRYTPGIVFAGRLPAGFGLATEYAAAVCAWSTKPALAMSFVALVAGDDSRALRAAGGFDV